MPSAARYSAATKQLVAELAERGHKVGCRAVEHWAELGLAPPPVKYSRGKHGFTSAYPPGAIDHYAAVASVMRRGQDWRVAGLLLIGRGYLVPRESTFRLLLEFLFEDIEATDDPLEFAEAAIREAADVPLFKRIVRLVRINISSAKIIDPVTKKEINAESAAPGIMALTFAAMFGEALPEGAAEEIGAAMGLIKSDLLPEGRLELVRYVEAIYSGPLTFSELSKAAKSVNPVGLQGKIVSIRRFFKEEQPIAILAVNPPALLDMWMIIAGLVDTIIDSWGGPEWFRARGIFSS